MTRAFVSRIAFALAAIIGAASLSSCGSTTEPVEAEVAAGDYAKGPHNGRLLTDGDFALEMTIFEDGVPPQFRVYPTRDGKPVDPRSVGLTVALKRIDGQIDRFAFVPQKDVLVGQGTVVEPHSFDVEVIAVERGKRHRWTYASPEGRTRIAADAAKAGGIVIEKAGPQTIGDLRELEGTVQLSPAARSEVRAQFPGRVVAVTREVGDYVRKGQLLARIESSESLQIYPVYSPVSGVVAERNANVGNVAYDQPIYVISDPQATTVVFNVFPRDLAFVRPGQRVVIETLDGQPVAETTLSGYLPEGNAEAGTALMRASLPNRDGRWRPGMALHGRSEERRVGKECA